MAQALHTAQALQTTPHGPTALPDGSQMEFALVLRELWQRKLLVAVGVLVAAIAAILSVYRIDGFKLKTRSLLHSSATTQILVDTPSSVLGNTSQSFDPLNSRATVYANFMASPAVLELIGRKVGLAGGQLYAAGPVDTLQPRTVQEPTALKRNVQITGETSPYRLNFNSDPNLPTIGVYAQAPTTQQAVALANASVVGLQQYVASIEKAEGIPRVSRVVIRQLGYANGGVVNGGISKSLAGLVFVAVFLLWCVLLLVGARFRENWRASKALYGGPQGEGQAEAAGSAIADSESIPHGMTPSNYPRHGNDDDYSPQIFTEHGGSPSPEEGEQRGAAAPPHMAGRS